MSAPRTDGRLTWSRSAHARSEAATGQGSLPRALELRSDWVSVPSGAVRDQVGAMSRLELITLVIVVVLVLLLLALALGLRPPA